MALKIQEGARPLFFAGQGYMGALEAYLTAGMFELFGSDRFTMTFAPSLLGSVWPVLMFWVLRTGFGRGASVVGAVMLTFPAERILRYTSVPYGGYPGTYVVGTALILHVLIRIHQKRFSPWKDAVLFSVLLFLGVWTNLQIIPYLAAASMGWMWILWPQRKSPSMWLPFVLAPVAFAVAFVPQMILSAQNTSSPPLFGSLRIEHVPRSVRALVTFDIPWLVKWKHSPPLLNSLTMWVMGLLVIFGSLHLIRCRKTFQPLLWLSAGFLLVFSALYFPHLMSGFRPRYVIALFSWGVALTAAAAVSSRSTIVKRCALMCWICWLGVQVVHVYPSMKVRKEKLDKKMVEINAVIHVARELELEAVRFIGSEMEGHRAAAFAFESKGNPAFVSSYDERRRDADLLWHTTDNPGYFFTEAYEPFVRGSLEAMQIPSPDIRPADRFRVMKMPEVETSGVELLPQDRVEITSTAWNEETRQFRIPEEGGEISMQFGRPTRIAGLRLNAPPHSSLPYQYTVTAERADGTRHQVASSIKRLGTSYRDGGRAFFKGYHALQDIRWTAVEAVGLDLKIMPGHLNKLPVQLEGIAIWGQSENTENDIDWEVLAEVLEKAPSVPVFAPDAWTAKIRREERGRLSDARDRIPLPWNPRDPRSQPPRIEFDLAQGLLIILPSVTAERTILSLEQFDLPFTTYDAGALTVLHVEHESYSTSVGWNQMEIILLQK
jgi:hypothetical protein